MTVPNPNRQIVIYTDKFDNPYTYSHDGAFSTLDTDTSITSCGVNII